YTEGARTIQSRNLSTYRNANSEVNEIDSNVCLTIWRKEAFYRWNSEDSLMNNKVFSTNRTVRA
ncbi:hypothetical protein DQG23_35395, partial [Paenibacillus contaminans]